MSLRAEPVGRCVLASVALHVSVVTEAILTELRAAEQAGALALAETNWRCWLTEFPMSKLVVWVWGQVCGMLNVDKKCV